jgi:hypothetical protein
LFYTYVFFHVILINKFFSTPIIYHILVVISVSLAPKIPTPQKLVDCCLGSFCEEK